MEKKIATFSSDSPKNLFDELKKYDFELTSGVRKVGNRVEVDVLIVESDIEKIKTDHINFADRSKVNVSDRGFQSQISKEKEDLFGKGNRFGNGFKTDDILDSYLNEDEFNAAILKLKSEYPNFVQLEENLLDSSTGRKSKVIKISNNHSDKSTGVLLIAGVHGNEVVPPDCLIYFSFKLCECLKHEIPLKIDKYVSNSFTISYHELKSIFDKIQLYIFPLVNPNGRASERQLTNSGRSNGDFNEKNRAGVDINRNYGFLWNYWDYFKYKLYDMARYPNDINKLLYIGKKSFSEPETKNVKDLILSNNNIEFFIDIHSGHDYEIKTYWSHDESQFTDSELNFTNMKKLKKKCGVEKDDYYEYMPKSKWHLKNFLATSMSDAIKGVNGESYKVPASNEGEFFSGCSRSYVDSLMYEGRNVYGFVIECGQNKSPIIEKRNMIISDLSVSFLVLCKNIAKYLTT